MIQRNLYLQQLIDNIGNGLVKTITGIRRCGKQSQTGKEIIDKYSEFIQESHHSERPYSPISRQRCYS